MTSILIYIRFSYFGRSDARLSHTQSEQERYDQLYNDTRMERRFYFFENITLPSLNAQTDKDFKVGVFASNCMPDKYKARLNGLLKAHPHIQVVYSDAGSIHDPVRAWRDDNLLGVTGPSVHIRHDDDDALSANMVARFRHHLPYGRPDEVFSFARGLYLTYQEDKPQLLHKVQPNIAIGWGLVTRPEQRRKRTVFEVPHAKFDRIGSTVVLPEPISYIHVAHAAQDTAEVRAKLLRAHKRHKSNADYGSEIYTKRMDKIIAREFPCFTRERLMTIIANEPGIRQTELSQSS